MAQQMTLASIDAGSNAIRMLIASATSASEFKPIFAERVAVRLGHNTFVHGELDPHTIERAITAFARFRSLFDEHGVEHYRAVATSAVRSADNGEDLIDRLYRDVGVRLEVIDGLEEARLVRKAVEHKVGPEYPLNVIVDLGGGSLEVTRRTDKGWESATMKIGTVRMLETFGLEGALSDDETRLIRRYVSSQLRANLDPSLVEESSAIACGGNAEALASLFGGTTKKGLRSIKQSQLEAALPKILGADIERRMSRWSVRQDRAEVMGVAAIIFAEVASFLGLRRFVSPGVGIREGVLLDLAEARVGALDATDAKSRDSTPVASARVFAARLRHNTAHGEQVRRISRLLFDELKALHELPNSLGVVLEVSALLHDIGEVVHRQSHHKHSEYLILNGRIPGLDSPDREMVASVARAHRKSMPTEGKHQTFTSLSEEQREQVKKIAAILRLADGLDSDHTQQVMAIRANLNEDAVTLNVTVDQSTREFHDAESPKREAFEQIFGRKLQVVFTSAAAGVEAAIEPQIAPLISTSGTDG